MKEISIVVLVIISSAFSYNSSKDEYRSDIKLNCPYSFDSLARMNVFTCVDKMPEYPGGHSAILKFIVKNFRYSSQENLQASFKIQFIVDMNGCIIAARIKDRDEEQLTLIEKVLLKVVYKIPRWRPGSCFGKSVPVMAIMPLYFWQIQNK